MVCVAGPHPLPRIHTQRYAPAFHQALLHRRQANSLQNRCGHIPERLRPQRERRHGWAERLPDAYDANRKTMRGLLPQAGHTTRCSYNEGCNGRSRQHRLWLQHHHRRAGRPLCARRLGATSEVQRQGRCPWSTHSMAETRRP